MSQSVSYVMCKMWVIAPWGEVKVDALSEKQSQSQTQQIYMAHSEKRTTVIILFIPLSHHSHDL